MEPAPQSLKQLSLPLYLTSFVGREQEQDALISLLSHRRLLTLVGAGGIGKTRLALHVAGTIAPSFSDGVFLIELAPLTDPAVLLHAVATTLHIATNPKSSLLSLLVSALQHRRCLLIFDTCEHLLAPCTSLIQALLQACSHLHILATSREPLSIMEETVWRMAALSYPQPGHTLTLEELAQYEALQLFCQRAAEINPRFHLTRQNAPAIVRICSQLDGIPLALELAAAHLSALSVDQLAPRLHERFTLLTHGERTAASHQQTLLATFDWSYALLTAVEQALFQRLAVFSGSWNLEAAEQIIGQAVTAPYALSDVLTHLVNKSLVIAEEPDQPDQPDQPAEGGAEIRYRLLDTTQQYALQKIQQSVDWSELCTHYTAWYLHLAEEASKYFHTGEQLVWLYRLEAEMPNIYAVLSRSLVLGDLDTAVRIAEAVSRFWIIRNHFSEGEYWFDTLLTALRDNPACPPSLQARILSSAAELACYQGANERACTLLEEEIALLQTLDDPSQLAKAQGYLGATLGLQGEYKRGQQLCQMSLDFYRASKQMDGVIRNLIALSFIALGQGKYLRAIALSEEACDFLRAAGDYSYLLYALFTLAQAAILQGNVAQARAACQESLQLSRQLGGQPFGLAANFRLIAGLAKLQGHPAQAARLFGAAQALQERSQTSLPPSGQALQERMVFAVRDSLGKEQFLFHYSAGQQNSLEQSLAEAETLLQAPPVLPTPETAAPHSSSPLAVLSQREREILALLATGLTDAQIAQHLLIRRPTVSSHVQSIYGKLHINSRGAATRLALQYGLL